MNKENENYLLGQELFNKGLRYTMIPVYVNGTVHADVYKGFDAEARRTNCGFSEKNWNKPWGYKTTSDVRTLF